MARDELKKRIESLNRKPLKNVPAEDRPDFEVMAFRRKLQKSQTVIATAPSREPSLLVTRSSALPSCSFEEAVEFAVKKAPLGPGYCLIEKSVAEFEPSAVDVHCDFLRLTGNPCGCAVERIASLCRAERIAPEEVVFLDLETTGLSMTPVFLIGTMECDARGFRFRQYFARDYSQESSIIAAFASRAATTRLLITFNGKSFDWPFLQNRGIAHCMTLHDPAFHLDLLHESRRAFGKTVPNCKLQTLERHICGRSREGDIPGAEIPAAYHDFVRTGNARQISAILEHNLHDLLTMADLMRRIWK